MGDGTPSGSRDRHVVDRLEHAEEHQPDAHAGREEHREPADIGVIGLGVLAAQPDAAPGADDQEQAEQHEDVRREQEEPVEGAGQRGPQPAEEALGLLGQRQRVEHEGHDGEPGDQKTGLWTSKPNGPKLPSTLSWPISYSVSIKPAAPSGVGSPCGVVSSVMKAPLRNCGAKRPQRPDRFGPGCAGFAVTTRACVLACDETR